MWLVFFSFFFWSWSGTCWFFFLVAVFGLDIEVSFTWDRHVKSATSTNYVSAKMIRQTVVRNYAQ